MLDEAMRRVRAITALTCVLALASCAMHGPGGVGYDAGGAPQGTGVTSGAGAGAVSGGSPPAGEKEQRGNTPPGFDREGHGPAAGAIVDPTGAAAGHKP